MPPTTLLQHYDSAALWPAVLSDSSAYTLPAAYQDALALRSLRLARGEKAWLYQSQHLADLRRLCTHLGHCVGQHFAGR